MDHKNKKLDKIQCRNEYNKILETNQKRSQNRKRKFPNNTLYISMYESNKKLLLRKSNYFKKRKHNSYKISPYMEETHNMCEAFQFAVHSDNTCFFLNRSQ